jgi:hypothetical protein
MLHVAQAFICTAWARTWHDTAIDTGTEALAGADIEVDAAQGLVAATKLFVCYEQGFIGRRGP